MMARPRTPSRAVLLAALALGVLASPGCGDDGDPVEAMGTLEVIEVDVAPMAPARVVRVWRREGDTVRAGDTLVSLTQATVRPEVEASRARLARPLVETGSGPGVPGRWRAPVVRRRRAVLTRGG